MEGARKKRGDEKATATKSGIFRMRYLVLIAVLTLTVYLVQMTVDKNFTKESPVATITSTTNQFLEGTVSRQSSTTEAVVKKNLMFIKTHKCGTSTLVDTFYLFGVRRKLNFVLNPNSHDVRVQK